MCHSHEMQNSGRYPESRTMSYSYERLNKYKQLELEIKEATQCKSSVLILETPCRTPRWEGPALGGSPGRCRALCAWDTGSVGVCVWGGGRWLRCFHPPLSTDVTVHVPPTGQSQQSTDSGREVLGGPGAASWRPVWHRLPSFGVFSLVWE